MGKPVRKFYVNGAVLVEQSVKGKPTGQYEDPRFIIEPVSFTDAEIERWYRGARGKWMEMGGQPPEPFQDLTRCANFGYGKPCDFYTACWGAGMNSVDFVRQPRRGSGEGGESENE